MMRMRAVDPSKQSFWAKQVPDRLWHLVDQGERTSKCGREIPPPRMSTNSEPTEDVRCAKCDKFVMREEEWDS